MRNSGERGATMVETAIGGLVLFFLLLVVVQGAFFGRAYLAAGGAAEAGSRAGSVAVTDPLADYDILQAVKRSLSSVPASDIRKIVVYRASDAHNFDVPTSCLTPTPVGDCNVYVAADLNRTPDDFDGSGSFAKHLSWAASTRSGESGDKLGVWVQLGTGGIGGLFPSVVSKASISDFEPA